MKNLGYLIMLLCFFFLSQLYASEDLPEGYQYVFPQSTAKYVHPSSTIILRFENISPNDLTNLSNLIKVRGELSGQHFGKTFIASDGRTIIFESERKYELGEKVDVEIHPIFFDINKENIKPYYFEFDILEQEESNSVPPDDDYLNSSLQQKNKVNYQPMIMPNGVSVPADFPHVNITQNNNPSSDYIFLNNWGPPNYNIIFNTSGSPVWYWKTPDKRRDFKVQSNGLITMLIRDGYGGSGEGHIVLTENFKFIKSIRASNGYYTDEHELFMLPDSGYFLIGRRNTTVDMSQYVTGGMTNATVSETCIQEFNSDDQLIFIWRAWDHFDIRDLELENLTSNYIRFPHMNAIYIDEDNHILLSSRHLSEISKINRQTGNFIWRMNGIPGSPNNDFQFVNDPLNGFRNQHAIRSLGNNRYTLFDNGNLHTPPLSRAVEYEIDTTLMTATLVWEFQNDIPNNYSFYMGNVQRLSNGNTHINWAVGNALPIAQEITPEGEKVFEMRFEDGYHCYRSFRHQWEGTSVAPYLLLEPQADNLTLLFNKFGDDSINYYNIYGGTAPNPTELIDTAYGTLKRLVNLQNGIQYYFRVKAVDNEGVESEFSNEENIVVNIVQPGTNLILNSDFSNGLESWIWELQGSGSANVQVENGICHFQIQNGGNEIYDVQLRQIGVPLIQGQNYTFEFDAWAEAARIVEIKVGQDNSPYINYSRIGFTALSTTLKHFNFQFEMQEPTDNSARVVINAGKSSQDIYIDNISLKMDQPTNIDGVSETVSQFSLYPNYPNPFNPKTNINYYVPERSHVKIVVYNMHGQEITTLLEKVQTTGKYKVQFDASNLASGIYFYKLTALSITTSKIFNETKKMILLK